ncbi:MAG: protein kinase [Alphaproteobacteria bacterium]|nr:protein kinase [Alphaproteobacteria bacterium]
MKPDSPLPDAPPPMARPADPFIGTEVAGRYRVLRMIAKGGMGAVYEAEQMPLGRKVALKVLAEPPSSNDAEAFAHRFFLEASSLARLSHPHTVTLFDYGQTDDGTYFLVMEYVDGVPLSKLLQREGPLPPDRAIRLMLQVARAVANAHRHGVVHRDLKPSNLLVKSDPDGGDVVKVVDFGLAKLTEGDQSITVTGMILGSPHCMAPEQVNGAEVDERTDIYALGVLLFRCVTGHYPFHGSTTTATMIAHIQNPIPTLEEVAPDREFPSGLEDIIRNALAKNPDARYPNVSALIRDLAACGQVPSEELSAVSTITLPPVKRRSALLPALAVSGLLAGLLGVGVLAALSGGGEDTVEEPASGPREIQVFINSTPAGAQVEIGGEALGATPLDTTYTVQPDAGRQAIVLRMDGYQEYLVQRDLSKRDSLELEVALAPVAVEESPEVTPPREASETVKEAPKQTTPAKDPPKPSTPEKTTPEKTSQPSVAPKETQEGSTEEGTPEGYKANPFD